MSESETEKSFRGSINRLLQLIARFGPGARTVRVALHRARGVHIGHDVWIGYDAILETSQPELVSIEDGVAIGMRAMLIAHFRETKGIRIERNAFVGPGAIIMPNVIIGEGAVVTAGSVVSRSVPPMTLVQGNPARPVARCGVALTRDVTVKEFLRGLSGIAHDKSDS